MYNFQDTIAEKTQVKYLRKPNLPTAPLVYYAMALLEKIVRRAVQSGILSKAIANLPKLSKLCTIIGVLWLFAYLPMEGNYRNTYISENALMPNQAYSYFRETEWNNVRGFRTELNKLEHKPAKERNEVVYHWLEDYGLKPAIYEHETYGSTLYAVLNAQRGDGTEAMVLTAPWFNGDGYFNTGALAVSVGLLRFFSTWPVWSKNIILVIPENPGVPLRSWVEAYHTSLPLTAGTIESAVVLDYTGMSDYFDYIDVEYAGLNGVLPNLDLVNTAVHVIEHEGMKVTINGMKNYMANDFEAKAQNVLLGIEKMAIAGLNNIKGHESFSGWRIQALTLKARGIEGPFDITTFGRVPEATFRSVNNMLEKFHQSFFFYLLLSPKWFVSIASYLPAAVLLSVSFALSALDAVFKSGLLNGNDGSKESILALVVCGLCIAFSFLLSMLSHVGSLHPQVFLVAQVSIVFSSGWVFSPSIKMYHCLKAAAFLYFSIVLTSLLVVHFALAFVIGILAFPMTLVSSQGSKLKNNLLLVISNPFIATFAVTSLLRDQFRWEIFDRMIFAWESLGCWTWHIVCIGWYAPWLVVALSNNVQALSSKNDEASKEKKNV